MNNENTIYDRKAGNEDTQYDNTRFAAGNADESTRYDGADESTRYDGADEETKYDNARQQVSTTPLKPQKKSIGKRVAIALGTSAVLGAGAAVLMSATPAENVLDPNKPDGPDTNDGPTNEHPDWTDGEVPVAQGVNEGMSFSEAFDAARAEVGPGGVFEWHGNIYSTYIEEEWDTMPQAERDEYGSHFSWNGHDNDVLATDATPTTGGDIEATATTTAAVDIDYTQGAGSGMAQQVSIDDTGDGMAQQASVMGDDATGDDVSDGDVQILGIGHDDQSGFNYASMTVNDHGAVLIDINNDNTFDVLAIDANDDNQISDNEMIDISDQNITMQQIEAVHGNNANVAASDDSYTGGAADNDIVDL